MNINRKRLIARVAAIALIVSAVGFQSSNALAASVTSFSDNLSRLKASTNANHEIFFVSPTGIAAGQTVILTFTGFVTSSVNAILFSDVDFATGSTSTCTSATYTEQTLAASPSGSTWGVAAATGAITITSGTGTLAASKCVRIRIGTNAVNQTTGVNQIQNNTAGSATIAITGTFGDTGTATVPIVANDQVQVTATVNAAVSFSISQTAIDFGPLDSANARFATAGAGSGGSGTSTTVGHTISASTNGTNGYIIYLSGDTLKSGANSVTAIGGTATTSSVGSAQFGLTLNNVAPSGGSGTATAPYSTNGSYAFNATPTTQVQVAGATGATASTTYSATYIANIPSTQQAGSYSTTLTYTATSSF